MHVDTESLRHIWTATAFDDRPRDQGRGGKRERRQHEEETPAEEPSESVELSLPPIRPSTRRLLAAADSVFDLSALLVAHREGLTVAQLQSMANGPYERLFRQAVADLRNPRHLLEI